MKLVDILARELKEWPEGAKVAVSDEDGISFASRDDLQRGAGNNWRSLQGSLLREHDILRTQPPADDYDTAIVTREQWQAAVDALNAAEWDGSGLPPVGAVCELWIGHNEWVSCTVMCHDLSGAIPVAVVRYAEHTYAAASPKILRPIRTAEQIAAQEREKGVKQLIEWVGRSDRRELSESFLPFWADL